MDIWQPGEEPPLGWRARVAAYLFQQAKDPGTLRSVAVGLAFAMGFVKAEDATVEIIALIGIGLSALSAALPAKPKAGA